MEVTSVKSSTKKNKTMDPRSFLTGLAIGIVLIFAAVFGAVADRLFGIKPLDYFVSRGDSQTLLEESKQKVFFEENVVIGVTENVSPSVVTVAAELPSRRVFDFSPFGGFSSRFEGGEAEDIGSGFIVSEDGLVVTNKHVVNDPNAKYTVVTQDGSEYEVVDVSLDPNNDLAVLKINGQGLKAIQLGSSEDLRVGQFVIAIGTALGELRHTVTTGVISGLGRGITAGSFYRGFVEKLDGVIQTDAAINPGNSGGPLLNSKGEVIGVNVAVASGAQNIGFAIPVDVVSNALSGYNETGSFPAKAFLGVQYQLIDTEASVLSKIPVGAYITSVQSGSPADTAGISAGDIITKISDREIGNSNDLSDIISSHEPGDNIALEIWREGEVISLNVTLSEFNL